MILDTFYLLFKADSKDLQKGAKEAVKTTEDVNRALKTTDDISNRLGSSFAGLIGHASGAITALLSVSAIMGGIEKATEYTHNIGLMSAQLGYSSEVLDAWGGAVEKAGGSAYYFQYTVQTMDIALKEMAKGGDVEAAKAFKNLGINIKDANGHAKNFIDLLPSIAKSFEGLTAAQSSALGYKMHLDYGTIMLLQKGSKEVGALVAREKELGVVTQQDTEIAEKFKIQQKDTQHAFRSLFVSIATEVLPIFEKVYKFFEQTAGYLREHKNLVIGTVLGITGVIAAYLIPSLFGVGAAGSLINKIFSKWFFVIAIIGTIGSAIGVLYDDFMTFRKGGESVIGDLVKKFPELKEIIDIIGDALDWVVNDLLKSFGVTPLDVLIGGLNIVLHLITEIYKGIKVAADLIKPLVNAVGTLADFVGANTDQSTENRATADRFNKIKEMNDKKRENIQSIGTVANFVGANADQSTENRDAADRFNKIKEMNDKKRENIQSILASSGSISNSSSSSNKTSNINTGPITINTQASNSDEIANAFFENLKKLMGQALNNYDDGVLA